MSSIDIDRDLLRSWPLPALDGGGDKETRGAVLVVAGCPEIPGAALLAAEASLRAGAGKLQAAVPKSVSPLLAVALPEARVSGFEETEHGGPSAGCIESLLDDCSDAAALLVGPGMADEAAVKHLATSLLHGDSEARCVLDAAALVVVHDPSFRFARTAILTPHAGEMAKIAGVPREQVERDPAAYALRIAARANAVVIMKGVTTHIAAPDGRLWCFEDGHVGLGMSGSGDVLAGLVTGLLARGAALEQAAAWGVALHGYAGQALGRRIGQLGYLARELAAEVPRIMEQLASSDSRTA